MIMLTPRVKLVCRLSLSVLWLLTAATSFWWGRTIGYDVLAQKNIQGNLADWFINAGSILDATIGLWLLTTYRLTWCYQLQIIVILSYSVLLTLIAPQFWLHPFGPISKNLPILALIFLLLYSDD